MDEITLRTLTVESYDENGEAIRVTLSPGLIQMVMAKSGTRQGQELKHTQVFFIEGGVAELWLKEVDLLTIETVVGAYGLPY